MHPAKPPTPSDAANPPTKPSWSKPPSPLAPTLGDDNCTSAKGDTWEVTFLAGNYLWSDDDSIVTNCQIDLHYRQGTKCISVAGSTCEEVKGESRVLNARLENEYGDLQIDAAASRTLQGASNLMVGEVRIISLFGVS